VDRNSSESSSKTFDEWRELTDGKKMLAGSSKLHGTDAVELVLKPREKLLKTLQCTPGRHGFGGAERLKAVESPTPLKTAKSLP